MKFLLPDLGNQVNILNFMLLLRLLNFKVWAGSWHRSVTRRQMAKSRGAYGCVYMCAHMCICICICASMDMYLCMHVYAHV